jgi:membrane protein required for colicin V production
MSLIDIAILATLLISALFAFQRGFARETITIFAWVATAVGTYFVFPWVRPLAQNAIPIGIAADIVALFVTFFGFLMVLSYFSKRLAGALRVNKPSQFDRALGFTFGLARGLILVAAGFWFLGFAGTDEDPPAFIAQANLYPIIDITAQAISAIVPQAGAPGAQGVASTSDPAYEARAGDADEDGYADSERRALDQLIESTSGD